MDDILEIIVRAFVAFLFLILLGPIIGKQLISQMGYHHFIGAITLGSLAGNMVFNIKIPFGYFLLSMVVFSLIVWFVGFLSMKNRTARAWVSGDPTVLVERGNIIEDNMRKRYYTLDMLHQSLRKKDIFDIHEVEYAVLESDGTLSVLKKAPYRGVIKSDLAEQ